MCWQGSVCVGAVWKGEGRGAFVLFRPFWEHDDDNEDEGEMGWLGSVCVWKGKETGAWLFLFYVFGARRRR